MEFLKANFFNTTTQATVDSNTAAVSNLFDRDLLFQYFSSGYDSGTTTSITISFDATTAVDRIAIMGHNLKSYTVFYDGSTANTFAMSSTSDTTVSDYSTNSETSQFLAFTSVNCTSVTFDLKDTQTAGVEKAIGHLVISQCELDFAQIPSAKDYRPRLIPKQTVHQLSDGGTRIQTTKEKFDCQIRFKYISETFRDNLKSIYDQRTDHIFVAFGTTTSWDERLHAVVWSGPFDFFRYSDDAATAGFSGTINLKETSL